MKSSTKLSWALCVSLFTCSYSARILQVAMQIYLNLGMAYGVSFVRGWESMAILIGAVLGPLSVWILSFWFNRKTVVVVALAIDTLSAVLVLSASTLVQVVVAGGFVGFSNIMICTAAALWQAENAEPHRRGPKIVLLLVAAGLGAVLSVWLNFIFNMTLPTLASVRAVVGIQLIFLAASTALVVFFATDSYRYGPPASHLTQLTILGGSSRTTSLTKPEPPWLGCAIKTNPHQRSTNSSTA
jgi:MFS family permease